MYSIEIIGKAEGVSRPLSTPGGQSYVPCDQGQFLWVNFYIILPINSVV